MTLETLDAVIDGYKKELEDKNKKYMTKMNHMHFERACSAESSCIH